MSDEKVSQTEEEQRRQNAQSNCAQAHVATGNAILRVHAPSGSPLHHYTAANANANVWQELPLKCGFALGSIIF